MWQRIVNERPLNIDVSDARLAAELSIPWKYFVLFANVDMAAVTAPFIRLRPFKIRARQARPLYKAIRRKQCRAGELLFMFSWKDTEQLAGLLPRVVVVFSDAAVRAENVTATALYCVSHGLTLAAPTATSVSTAGFCFSAVHEQYIATSLHGLFDARKPYLSRLKASVLLADAFRTDDEKLTGAGEVGHVICDWQTDFVDVGLIQLLDQHQSAAAWYTEEQVVTYMIELIKSTYDIEPVATRVLIHSAACFRGTAGEGPIPATLLEVNHIVSQQRRHDWHLILQLDDGFKVLPGQSGSAVTLESDGRPIGMLVARYKDDHTKAIVTPLHHIYSSLNKLQRERSRHYLQMCHTCPATVAASQNATTHIDASTSKVVCTETKQVFELRESPASAREGVWKTCCPRHTVRAEKRALDEPNELVASRIREVNRFLANKHFLPSSCEFWR